MSLRGIARVTSRLRRLVDILSLLANDAKKVRNVTSAEKAAVFHSYDLAGNHTGYCQNDDKLGCEVDHLISLELGGSNDQANLWPEPYGVVSRVRTEIPIGNDPRYREAKPRPIVCAAIDRGRLKDSTVTAVIVIGIIRLIFIEFFAGIVTWKSHCDVRRGVVDHLPSSVG